MLLELLRELDEHLDPMKRAHLLKEALASQEELVDLVNRVLDATTMVGEIPLAKLEAHPGPPDPAGGAGASGSWGCTSLHDPPARYPSRSWFVLTHSSCVKCCSICLPMSSSMFPHRQRSALRLRKQILLPPVCLSVQDAGPGIPAEELPLLFEKFVRLKRDLAGSTRGTGLGLYICKQLVEAMGWRIWVESSGHLGEGSRFCVTLPPFSPP